MSDARPKSRAGDGDAFFYRDDGSADLLRFSRDDAPLPLYHWEAQSFLSGAGAWTHVIYVGRGRTLFYCARSGEAVIGHFEPWFVEDWAGPLGNGWTSIVAANDGLEGPYLFLYDARSGAYLVSEVTTKGAYRMKMWGGSSGCSSGWTDIVAAGQTYLLFYNSWSGDIALAEFAHGEFRTLWVDDVGSYDQERPGAMLANLLCGVENGLVVFYSPQGGEFATYGVRPAEKVFVNQGVVGGVRRAMEALRAAGRDDTLTWRRAEYVVALGGGA